MIDVGIESFLFYFFKMVPRLLKFSSGQSSIIVCMYELKFLLKQLCMLTVVHCFHFLVQSNCPFPHILYSILYPDFQPYAYIVLLKSSKFSPLFYHYLLIHNELGFLTSYFSFFRKFCRFSVVNLLKHHQENIFNHTNDKLLIGRQESLINASFFCSCFFLVPISFSFHFVLQFFSYFFLLAQQHAILSSLYDERLHSNMQCYAIYMTHVCNNMQCCS